MGFADTLRGQMGCGAAGRARAPVRKRLVDGAVLVEGRRRITVRCEEMVQQRGDTPRVLDQHYGTVRFEGFEHRLQRVRPALHDQQDARDLPPPAVFALECEPEGDLAAPLLGACKRGVSAASHLACGLAKTTPGEHRVSPPRSTFHIEHHKSTSPPYLARLVGPWNSRQPSLPYHRRAFLLTPVSSRRKCEWWRSRFAPSFEFSRRRCSVTCAVLEGVS